MAVKYSSEHEIFRAAFRKFVENELVPHRDEWNEAHIVPREAWRKMGEQGFLCTGIDPEYGGAGADYLYSVIMVEEISKTAMSLGFGMHSDIIAPYIESFGTEEQKLKYLPKCATGECILALAMTEPGAGSDAAAMRTTALRDGDEYVINGQKVFISNGGNANLVVVAAKTDPKAGHRGVSLFLVEAGTPGFEKGKSIMKMGQHSSDTVELFFQDCRVPVSSRLGEEGKGFSYLMHKLTPERILIAIEAQAMCEQILEDVIEYTKNRVAFGQPISKFQNTQFKLADMATEITLGRTMLNSLIEEYIETVEGIEHKDLSKKVSMCKMWITDLVNSIAYRALQMYGGYGYCDEYLISHFYRNVRVLNIAGGSSEIMKTIIAKDLGL